MRLLSLKLSFALLLTTIVIPAFTPVQAQNQAAADVVMVLPFENISNRPEYNWVGESFADALAELLNKPGLVVVTSDERELAYQQLRLPETVIPSRATAIKLARQAKASIIVIGSYSVTVPQTTEAKPKSTEKQPGDAYVQVNARVIKINEGRNFGEVKDGSWITRQFDRGDALTSLQEFTAGSLTRFSINATRRCPIHKTRSFRKPQRFRKRLLRLM